MNYKFLLINLIVFFNAQANWLSDLAVETGKKNDWDNKLAISIMDKYIKEDEKKVEEIQLKIKEQSAQGMWASFHLGAYKVELKAVESQQKYHEKIKKEINDLNENKKDREKFFTNLKELNQKYKELEELKKDYHNENDTYEKIKIGAKITLKNAEISSKEIFIKSSFFLS